MDESLVHVWTVTVSCVFVFNSVTVYLCWKCLSDRVVAVHSPFKNTTSSKDRSKAELRSFVNYKITPEPALVSFLLLV